MGEPAAAAAMAPALIAANRFAIFWAFATLLAFATGSTAFAAAVVLVAPLPVPAAAGLAVAGVVPWFLLGSAAATGLGAADFPDDVSALADLASGREPLVLFADGSDAPVDLLPVSLDPAPDPLVDDGVVDDDAVVVVVAPDVELVDPVDVDVVEPDVEVEVEEEDPAVEVVLAVVVLESGGAEVPEVEPPVPLEAADALLEDVSGVLPVVPLPDEVVLVDDVLLAVVDDVLAGSATEALGGVMV